MRKYIICSVKVEGGENEQGNPYRRQPHNKAVLQASAYTDSSGCDQCGQQHNLKPVCRELDRTCRYERHRFLHPHQHADVRHDRSVRLRFPDHLRQIHGRQPDGEDAECLLRRSFVCKPFLFHLHRAASACGPVRLDAHLHKGSRGPCLP